MNLKDRIILALILVLFTVAVGYANYGVHTDLDQATDEIDFLAITRTNLDDICDTGIKEDSAIFLDLDDTRCFKHSTTSGDTNIIPLTDDDGKLDISFWDMSEIDSGVQTITDGDFLTNSGDAKNPILNVDVDDNSEANTRLWTAEKITSELADKADTPHNHDDRYYTETELNNGQLDNRYYTETESDTLLDDKVALADSDLHTHTESDITDLDKYSQSAVDTLLDAKVAKADTGNWELAYAHISNDGSDHSFIDQSVVSGSSPTFTGANFTAMDANDVNIADDSGIITATDVEIALQENRTAIDLNTAKTTNATHTGEVTGATALALDPTCISGKVDTTIADADYVLFWDATDSTLKKVDAAELTAGGGAVAWGAITGTLSSQTDLEARFTQGWKERQLLAFRQNNYEYMIDGFNNPFDVENEGIDTTNSDTYLYNAAGDYYYQDTIAGSTTELDYMEYDSN